MDSNRTPKRSAAFTWLMFGLYVSFFGSAGFFESPSAGELPLFLVLLGAAAACFCMVMSIIRAPHEVDRKSTSAPGFLFAFGAVYLVLSMSPEKSLFDKVVGLYMFVGMASMGLLVGLYKKTGTVKEEPAPTLPPAPALPARTPVQELCASLSRASCFPSGDPETDLAARRCLELAEGLREKKIPVPPQVADDMRMLSDAYSDLADDLVATERTTAAKLRLGRAFPVMAKGLENIYDAGVLKDLEEAEAEAMVLEGQLRLAGFMDSDFKDGGDGPELRF